MRALPTILAAFAAVLAAAGAAPTADSLPDAAVVRKLIAALKEPDAEVRQNIGVALAKIGGPAVEPLTEALKDPAPERRAGAAYALALIGPAARSALPDLLDLLSDKDVDVRRQASLAIGRLVAPRGPGGPGVARTPFQRGELP